MKKHLKYKDENSDGFWIIEVNGRSFTVIYASTKEFDTEEKCMKEAEKLVSEKVKKGYRETSGNSTPYYKRSKNK
jgi:predicted DNA-binding WGR domain protein